MPRVVAGFTYHGARTNDARRIVRASWAEIGHGFPIERATSNPCTRTSASAIPVPVATSSSIPEYHGYGSDPRRPLVVSANAPTLAATSSTWVSKGTSRASRICRSLLAAMSATSPSGDAVPAR